MHTLWCIQKYTQVPLPIKNLHPWKLSKKNTSCLSCVFFSPHPEPAAPKIHRPGGHLEISPALDYSLVIMS
jgi:hypothetical protein